MLLKHIMSENEPLRYERKVPLKGKGHPQKDAGENFTVKFTFLNGFASVQ